MLILWMRKGNNIMMNMIKFCDKAFDARMRFLSELSNIAKECNVPDNFIICYLMTNFKDDESTETNLEFARAAFNIDFPNDISRHSEDRSF